jgi:hypothetical protein
LAIANQTDDAVKQRPDDLRVEFPLFHTQAAGPGAVTNVLLRRIAFRAGAYAPGIQEHMFFELNTGREGGTLAKVESWFSRRTPDLHAMGYRLSCRRISEPTERLMEWVKQGKGFRAAMIPVGYLRLHSGISALEADNINWAVGATMEMSPGALSESMLVLDPWPGVGGSERVLVTDEWNKKLDRAHREQKYFALTFYWSGWA